MNPDFGTKRPIARQIRYVESDHDFLSSYESLLDDFETSPPGNCPFTQHLQKSTLQRVVTAKSVLNTARLITTSPKHYRVYLALDKTVVRAAQALRFRVFNLELHEGLVQSFQTGLDQDPFDAACDHLVVEHRASDRKSTRLNSS